MPWTAFVDWGRGQYARVRGRPTSLWPPGRVPTQNNPTVNPVYVTGESASHSGAR
jgi:hypothetical protein